MRNSIRGKLLLVFAFWLAAVAASGQGQASPKPVVSSLEVAVTYDAALCNVTTGAHFFMNGGSVQIHGQFWHGLGVVADVAGVHAGNVNKSGVGLDMVTATFGPRYTFSRSHSRYSFFGQALVGEGFGMNSTFPAASGADTVANGLAMQLGGGVSVSLSRRFSLRAVEAGWLRAQVPNGTDNVQNNLRIGAGFIYRRP